MTKKAIFGPTALAAGVLTDQHFTEVDFQKTFGQTKEFWLEARVQENTVAPGAARTIAIDFVWSHVPLASVAVADLSHAVITGVSAPDRLLETQQVIPRVNTASSDTQFPLNLTSLAASTSARQDGIIRPKARYLYFWITKTTEDAGSIPTLTIWIALARPVNK